MYQDGPKKRQFRLIQATETLDMVKFFQMMIECERTGESVTDKLEDLLQKPDDFDLVIGSVVTYFQFLISSVKRKDQSDKTRMDLKDAFDKCDNFFGNKFLRIVTVIEIARDYAGLSQELSEKTAGIEDVIKLKEWGWKDVAWAYYVRSAIVKSGEEIVTKDIFDRTSEQLYNRRESYLESLSERSIRVFKGQLPGANISKIK